MSQLYEWRRKVLKKSQEALAEELGYGDKWATYAAQERGDNPLPEDVKERLRAKPYKFAGLWPDDEIAPLTKADLDDLRTHLDRKIEAVLAALQAQKGR